MDTSTRIGSGARATRREWLGLAVLALPTLLISFDMSVLYLALPHLAADLQPSSAQLLGVVDVYGFMVAGFLITMGRLGDRIGRRRLLLIGAAAFGVAMGVALLGSLGTAIYRGQVTVPGGIPAEAAAATRDTLAGAVAAAEELPAGTAAQMLESAREAFTHGLTVTAGLGTVAMAVFGVLAVVLLRPGRPGDEQQPADRPEGAAT